MNILANKTKCNEIIGNEQVEQPRSAFKRKHTGLITEGEMNLNYCNNQNSSVFKSLTKLSKLPGDGIYCDFNRTSSLVGVPNPISTKYFDQEIDQSCDSTDEEVNLREVLPVRETSPSSSSSSTSSSSSCSILSICSNKFRPTNDISDNIRPVVSPPYLPPGGNYNGSFYKNDYHHQQHPYHYQHESLTNENQNNFSTNNIFSGRHHNSAFNNTEYSIYPQYLIFNVTNMPQVPYNYICANSGHRFN